MTTMPDLSIVSGDSVPDTVPDLTGESDQWFDPEVPYSTPEHPHGFFEDANGDPDYSRPRKRRKRGTGSAPKTTSTGNPRASGNARAAAAVLARMNTMLGLGLLTFGLRLTAEQLKQANAEFESMAYEALVADPALCKKILSAGASSGRTQLLMAYAMLGVAVAPVAFGEIKDKRIVEGETYAE